MSKNLLSKWAREFRGLRSDERGAESTEVILVLVLLVIGLIGAWKFLGGKLTGKINDTANCVDGASNFASGKC
jgi:Flp pilus assembly pilin Flp